MKTGPPYASNLTYEKDNFGVRRSAECRMCVAGRRPLQLRSRYSSCTSRGRSSAGVCSRAGIYPRAPGVRPRTTSHRIRATARGLCATSGCARAAAGVVFRIRLRLGSLRSLRPLRPLWPLPGWLGLGASPLSVHLVGSVGPKPGWLRPFCYLFWPEQRLNGFWAP